MINRTEAPKANSIGQINFIKPVLKKLNNGIPAYSILGGEQEMLRVEILIENKFFDANKPLNGMAVSALLKNGTKTHSAKELVEIVDYFGAFLDAEYTSDRIIVTLYVLEKYFSDVLPILKEVVLESAFPEEELVIYRRNQQQKFKVNIQKNDFLVKKVFAHELFGNTPYGIDIQLEHYDALTRQDLVDYYTQSFVPENMTILISGNVQAYQLNKINELFGEIPISGESSKALEYIFESTTGRKVYIEKPDALQSAIRVGTISINRNHPDYVGLCVLNCVLGGYFGSRLMTNIREDKGYTYGVGSALIPLKEVGQFFITTEVGVDVCASALEEIYKEIELLRNEEISLSELELVRNFMLGSLLGSLENIFSHTQKFKNLLASGLDYDYYDHYIKVVKTIDSAALKALANKYLDPSNFIEVVVGKK